MTVLSEFIQLLRYFGEPFRNRSSFYRTLLHLDNHPAIFVQQIRSAIMQLGNATLHL